ncbi:MAG TPA: glycerophosphodiester phosphodiesterase [Thermodesulfovibrionales bacterium]|nr:glycerophosphodiester phosphodiesterase [Thermodesulfovibrionales bacterium]
MLLKIGHRGARTYETENTLNSFEKAIELGANAIEFDVRESGDSELVVSHDDNLKKVFDREILVSGTSLAELKRLTENRIATLREALLSLGGKVEKILVELKESGYEQKALEEIRRENLRDKVILVSFHAESLAAVRELDKEIETGLVYAKIKRPVETALSLSAQYLVPLYRFVHRRDVIKAHKDNLKVIVWTINTRKDIEVFIAKDVDGIATDKPALFRGIS